MTPDREALGRLVRDEWIAWAREQDNPKPSWLAPWEELSEPDREVDRRIGERLYGLGRDDAADDLVGYVERQRCCGAPSLCGAACQDSADDDAIARGAEPMARRLRMWKPVDRARRQLDAEYPAVAS